MLHVVSIMRHCSKCLKVVKTMGDLTQAEYKVAYANIIKNWSVDKSGKMPSLTELNLAASLGHAHQSNNTVVGAMGLRKGGFLRSQMVAYCKPCLNSRNDDIEAGLIREVMLPDIGGKRVYAQVFVRPKVAVKAAVVTAPKPTPKVKPKGATKRKANKRKAPAKPKATK
jgi:hypothetical protein